jgi:hypothetical protein
MQRRIRFDYPLLPPTGSPDCRRAGTSVRRCMPHGVRHPDGETDRRSRRRGQAAGTPARTIRMPPVSSIWNPGPEMGTNPGSSSEPEPGRRPCPGPPRRNRPPRPRPPGRRRMRPPGASIFLFRHHAERRGRSGKTHGYPPLWRQARATGMAVRAARERTFCRTREPGGRARDAGLVPGGPEGRWAAEPVMPEPTGTGPGRGRETSARHP